jgi:hypothetical protein
VLPDHILQLLTAFVDGELDERQRDEVLRLLQKSSEARTMMMQLQEASQKLRQMPRYDADPGLKDQIMEAIVAQLGQRKPPAPSRGARRRWLPYVAAAMAASVLIATIGVVYWKTMIDAPQFADNKELPKVQPEIKPGPKLPPEVTPPTKKPKYPIEDILVGVYGGFAEPEKLFNAKFKEFQEQRVIDQFTNDVTRRRAVELDVTVQNNKLAMDRLTNVLKHHNIVVVEDPSARKSLNDKNRPKTEYLVYAENLTTDEMTKLMRELGESFVISPNGKNEQKVQSPYQKVTVASISGDEKTKLAKSLGVNPATLEEPKENKNVKPDAKRIAVVLPTAATAAPSAELKQFVQQRRPLQAGTVQVLIKIRQE